MVLKLEMRNNVVRSDIGAAREEVVNCLVMDSVRQRQCEYPEAVWHLRILPMDHCPLSMKPMEFAPNTVIVMRNQDTEE